MKRAWERTRTVALAVTLAGVGGIPCLAQDQRTPVPATAPPAAPGEVTTPPLGENLVPHR